MVLMKADKIHSHSIETRLTCVIFNTPDNDIIQKERPSQAIPETIPIRQFLMGLNREKIFTLLFSISQNKILIPIIQRNGINSAANLQIAGFSKSGTGIKLTSKVQPTKYNNAFVAVIKIFFNLITPLKVIATFKSIMNYTTSM